MFSAAQYAKSSEKTHSIPTQINNGVLWNQILPYFHGIPQSLNKYSPTVWCRLRIIQFNCVFHLLNCTGYLNYFSSEGHDNDSRNVNSTGHKTIHKLHSPLLCETLAACASVDEGHYITSLFYFDFRPLSKQEQTVSSKLIMQSFVK
jgi:hypothetical protein